MTRILLPIALSLGCLSLSAAGPAFRLPNPEPPPHGEGSGPCVIKGCPRTDQNGEAPTSCQYTSGMATGWRCLLICTYPKSQWATLVDGSNCR